MKWHELGVSNDGTHHVLGGVPAYAARFDEVLKFHAPGLAPVRSGQAAWHIDPEGREGYARRFRRTFGFYEGLASVVADDGWHHITPDGSDAYAKRYAWCGNFQGGRCAVREGAGSYLHIDGAGAAAYPERWRYAGDYRDGIAVVQAESGRSTHVDVAGRRIHGACFLDLDVFHKGFARARDEHGWTHVDLRGEPIHRRRFAAVEPFYNGQARVERFDGGLEVIDEQGASVVELRPGLRSELAALSGDMVGFWRTRTIGAAVELGVIDVLPATSEEVASQCQLDLNRCRRLLRALGELAIVVDDPPVWRLTARGAYLRSDHPLTLAAAAREYAEPMSRLWDALPEAIRIGERWLAPDVFAEVAREEPRCEAHHRMLQSYARHDYALVPEALGLRGDERIVDAGGGLGFLANATLDRYPQATVTVLERPEVVAHAARLSPERAGLRWFGGDFFAPWGLEADVVLLARVLHDWDDARAAQILRRAREVLVPGGRLLLIEMVTSEDGFAGALCDLHLLMVNGGRERTVGQFRSLLDVAGFELGGVTTLVALPSVIVGVAR